MYVDKQLLLADAQVVCNSGSELSENIIDLGAAKNVAKGKALYLIIIVDTTFETATSIDFQVMTHTTTTVSSGDIMCSTGAIAIASLTAGCAPIVLPIGDALNSAHRYLGVYCVLGGSNATAGAVTMFIGCDPA
jgi:hypothetical protein